MDTYFLIIRLRSPRSSSSTLRIVSHLQLFLTPGTRLPAFSPWTVLLCTPCPGEESRAPRICSQHLCLWLQTFRRTLYCGNIFPVLSEKKRKNKVKLQHSQWPAWLLFLTPSKGFLLPPPPRPPLLASPKSFLVLASSTQRQRWTIHLLTSRQRPAWLTNSSLRTSPLNVLASSGFSLTSVGNFFFLSDFFSPYLSFHLSKHGARRGPSSAQQSQTAEAKFRSGEIRAVHRQGARGPGSCRLKSQRPDRF